MSKRYVQHISGQWQKWEVMAENGEQWGLGHDVPSIGWHFVPKSEYRLCPAPEMWKDVTKDCVGNNRCTLSIHHMGRVCTSGGESYPDIYRLRKVQLWQTSGLDGKNCAVAAFIVEKKVSE